MTTKEIQKQIVTYRQWLRDNGLAGNLKAKHVIKLATWKNDEQLAKFKAKPRWNQHWIIKHCRELVHYS
jgi:2-succinyl-5-enolpyruvyl-6-hydroxy-3-cyclohexene-1-carboxylate synthase